MLTAYRISANEARNGVSAAVPAAWLAPLLDGSRLHFQYEVGFHDGARQASGRVSFAVRNPRKREDG